MTESSRRSSASHGVLSELFEHIDGWWIDGADLPPAELESAIDEAARHGDAAALTKALAAYKAAAWASCVRQGAVPR